jgi:hypothetical protein
LTPSAPHATLPSTSPQPTLAGVEKASKIEGHERERSRFSPVRDTLSVQVHPSDQQTKYLPLGETGKTEAWVVLEAGTQSRIYAGLKPSTTADSLRQACNAPDFAFKTVKGRTL